MSESAIGFGSEHSDRCGLDSWCAALNFGACQRNVLGRWGAQGPSDKYVRTAMRIIETLQNVAARAARDMLQHGPDWFGEEQTLYGLKEDMRNRGIDRELINAQIRRLTSANSDLDIPDSLPDDVGIAELEEPAIDQWPAQSASSCAEEADGTASAASGVPTVVVGSEDGSMLGRLQAVSQALIDAHEDEIEEARIRDASGRLASPADEPAGGEKLES